MRPPAPPPNPPPPASRSAGSGPWLIHQQARNQRGYQRHNTPVGSRQRPLGFWQRTRLRPPPTVGPDSPARSRETRQQESRWRGIRRPLTASSSLPPVLVHRPWLEHLSAVQLRPLLFCGGLAATSYRRRKRVVWAVPAAPWAVQIPVPIAHHRRASHSPGLSFPVRQPLQASARLTKSDFFVQYSQHSTAVVWCPPTAHVKEPDT